MGCSFAVFQREGGNVWRFLCWRDSNAGRHGTASAPGRNFSCRDRFQLSRWMDVPGRRLRTVVQRILDVRAGTKYSSTPCAEKYKRFALDGETAALQLSGSRTRHGRRLGILFSGLAATSNLRRLLESMVH